MKDKLIQLKRIAVNFFNKQIDDHGFVPCFLFTISLLLGISGFIAAQENYGIALKFNKLKASVEESVVENKQCAVKLQNAKVDNDQLRAIEFNDLVDPAIIKGIIAIESSGNPNAHNKGEGAVGLMQLRPIVYNKICGMTKEEAFDPKKNVACGSLYFKHLLNRFRGNLEQALHFYNSGSIEENGYASKVARKICKGKNICLSQLLVK